MGPFIHMFALLACSVLARDTITCLTGTWRAKGTECHSVLGVDDIIASVTNPRPLLLSVDVNPSRWFHPNIFQVYLNETNAPFFDVSDNRARPIGKGNVIFETRCTWTSNFSRNGLTYSLNIWAGRGNLSIAGSGRKCQIFVEKEIVYESWRFSLSVLFGVVAMFMGFGSQYGWTRNDFLRPVSIPVDNPGQEYEVPEEKAQEEEDDDEFLSDDGY